MVTRLKFYSPVFLVCYITCGCFLFVRAYSWLDSLFSFFLSQKLFILKIFGHCYVGSVEMVRQGDLCCIFWASVARWRKQGCMVVFAFFDWWLWNPRLLLLQANQKRSKTFCCSRSEWRSLSKGAFESETMLGVLVAVIVVEGGTVIVFWKGNTMVIAQLPVELRIINIDRQVGKQFIIKLSSEDNR